MKRTKTLTKKERKAVAKAIRELGPVNQKPHKEHKHDMWCLTSYLARQAEAKHEKMHARQERAATAKARMIAARKAAKAAKAAKRAAKLEKANAQ